MILWYVRELSFGFDVKLSVYLQAQKSGYLDTSDSRHFFFYHFESRSDPKNDPIVLWVNGGPGCRCVERVSAPHHHVS